MFTEGATRADVEPKQAGQGESGRTVSDLETKHTSSQMGLVDLMQV